MDNELSRNRTQNVGFTQVPNSILNNSDISWKAKGLWAYMAGKPEGWRFTLRGMAAQSKDGIKATVNCLDELMAIGLVKREEEQTHDGKRCLYSIYRLEDILGHKNDERQNAKRETSQMETSHLETSHLETSKRASYSNTNISNTHLSNTKPSNTHRSIVSNDTKAKPQYGDAKINRAFEIWEEVMGKPLNVDTENRKAARWLMSKSKGEQWIRDKLELLKRARTYDAFRYSRVKIYDLKSLFYQANALEGFMDEQDALNGNNNTQALTEKVEMTSEIEEMFDFWKQWVGIGCPRDNENVKACRDLLDDIKKGQLQRLIVGVALRGNTPGFVVGEITKIKDFVGLKQNAAIMQTFCNENWDYWNLVLKAASTGKNIWEVY